MDSEELFFEAETRKHQQSVANKISFVVQELLHRARQHDATKLVFPERQCFVEYTPKLRDLTYGTPEYKKSLDAMGPALEHHYEHNRHHPEHFNSDIGAMTLIDLLEMLCDWMAATERHRDSNIFRSITQNQARFGYDDTVARILKNTAKTLLDAADREPVFDD